MKKIWLKFEEDIGGMLVFIRRGGISLGRIWFNPKWNCFVFEPFENTLWAADCLLEIVDKLKELEYNKKLKLEKK